MCTLCLVTNMIEFVVASHNISKTWRRLATNCSASWVRTKLRPVFSPSCKGLWVSSKLSKKRALIENSIHFLACQTGFENVRVRLKQTVHLCESCWAHALRVMLQVGEARQMPCRFVKTCLQCDRRIGNMYSTKKHFTQVSQVCLYA